MISAVSRNATQYDLRQRTQSPQNEPADALTVKRSEEARQRAIAAVNQQQRAKVQQAIASYMSLGVSEAADNARTGATLAQAQGAYGEF